MLNQQLSNVILIVSILPNQYKNIEKLIHSIKRQSTNINTIIFSCVNCVENESIDGIYHFIKSSGTSPKNDAISYMIKNHILYDIIIFIDGDCIPQHDLIETHVKICNKQIPILSCGMCREKRITWKDFRESYPALIELNAFKKDIIINDLNLIKQGLVAQGCNIALNKYAIDLICRLNKLYYNKYELFCSSYTNEYTYDSFLAIEAWVSKVFIVLHKGAVECITNVVIERKNDKSNLLSLDLAVSQLKLKLIATPLNLDFFDYIPLSSSIPTL